MRIQPILERLAGLDYVTLQGAFEFAELKTIPARLPALFVVPQRASASPSIFASGIIDQQLSEAFAVIIVFDRGRVMPGQISEAIEARKIALLDCLATWKHPNAESYTRFTGWQLLSHDGNCFTYAFNFEITSHYRKVIS